MNQVFADLGLARRLERAEGQAGVSFVKARARVQPSAGAAWDEIAGADLMFDGPRSPITQTFGFGMFQEAKAEDLDRIDSFFTERGAGAFHEISPLADVGTMPLLCSRGYQPVEFTSVMFMPIQSRTPAPSNDRVRARVAGLDEHETWARVGAEGWRQEIDFGDLMLDLGRVVAAREDGPVFLAEIEGKPVGAGALSIYKGVALLAGASTIPEARKQGAQGALLEARLQYAVNVGCDLAMMCAAPGSSSQRNAERQGFRIAYTRIKWGRQP